VNFAVGGCSGNPGQKVVDYVINRGPKKPKWRWKIEFSDQVLEKSAGEMT
jgi:hypothetical protein